MEPASVSQKNREVQVIEQLGKAKELMLREIHKVIIGQDEIIEQILICS